MWPLFLANCFHYYYTPKSKLKPCICLSSIQSGNATRKFMFRLHFAASNKSLSFSVELLLLIMKHKERKDNKNKNGDSWTLQVLLAPEDGALVSSLELSWAPGLQASVYTNRCQLCSVSHSFRPSQSSVKSVRDALMNALLLMPIPSVGHKTSLRKQEISKK